MSTITTADFQKGLFINFKNEPHQITEFQFVNPGKGSAFVRTKLRNIKTGKVQEFTFKSGETVESLPVEMHEMQYLYKSGFIFVFMDTRNYEQINVSKEILGNFANFLKESDIYQLQLLNHVPIGIRIPKKVKLSVIEADEGVRGNTVMGAKKLVLLETDIQVAVPLFIKTGDIIVIDPESGEYIERASQK